MTGSVVLMHGLGTTNESFVYHSQLKFCHCVSPVRDFAFNHFFSKKLMFSYILQDFLFGIGIWIWAVENLGSSHHASVVRNLMQYEDGP